MLLKLKILLLSAAIISSAVVNADDTGAKLSNENKNERHATNMTLILKDNLYEIQQNTSTIEFRVDSPVGEIWGSFHDFEGSFIMLNNDAQNQSAVVDINAGSLDTDASFIRALLKSEVFFDVEKFPSVRFVGSSFEWFSDTRAVLKGYMTIQNITQPVAFYVELIDANDENRYSESITVKASTTIKRSVFGIHSMLPAVSDNVNLFMSIDALMIDTAVSMM